MADPISLQNATFVPADTLPPGSITTLSINTAIPGPTGNPINPLAPPANTTGGGAFVNSVVGNNQTIFSINVYPTGPGTWASVNPGQAGSALVLDPLGNVTSFTTLNALASFTTSQFENTMTIDKTGDIISEAPLTRYFRQGWSTAKASDGTAPTDVVSSYDFTIDYGRVYSPIIATNIVVLPSSQFPTFPAGECVPAEAFQTGVALQFRIFAFPPIPISAYVSGAVSVSI